MTDRLGDIVPKVRSKNAGPFWLTIDVFCGSEAVFDRVAKALQTKEVARRFAVAPEAIKRFDIAALHVVKFSLPRPVIQGNKADRDMHGASFAAILAEMEV